MKLPPDDPFKLTLEEKAELAKLPTLDKWLGQRVEVTRPLSAGVVPSLPLDAGVVLLPSLSLDELLSVLGCFVRRGLAMVDPIGWTKNQVFLATISY